VGRGVYLPVSHASHPKRAEFHSSPISGFSYIYEEFITPEGRVEQDNAETTQNTTILQDRVRAIA